MIRNNLGNSHAHWFRNLAMLCLMTALLPSAVLAQNVRVTITNNAPEGGNFVTPVWVGFHDGSFDSYDGGLSSQPGLERIAEDGDTSAISGDFLDGLTYIDNSGDNPVSATVASDQSGSERVDGMIGEAPIGPGGSVELEFTIDLSEANRYFSYVSMVLPSNDYYVANGNPSAHDLESLFNTPGASVTFDIGQPGSVNDAGTEVNLANITGDEDMEDDSIAGFGVLGEGYMGQSMPNTGGDEGGVNANVTDAYAEAPSLLERHPELDFNDASAYPNGIATITITRLDDPMSDNDQMSTGLCGLGAVAFLPLMFATMFLARIGRIARNRR